MVASQNWKATWHCRRVSAKRWKNRNQVNALHFVRWHFEFNLRNGFDVVELDDFLQELDEDVEGMQSTILFLQQELKLAKDTITTLERENSLLKNGATYDNVALKKHYKDAGGGVDATILDNSSGNYLINGSRLPTASVAELTAHSIRSENSDNRAGNSSTTPTLDANNTATNLNSYNTDSNCERVSKTSLSNNCTAKNSSSSSSSAAPHIVLVETRTLRSSGRNINSVVDELRNSKLKSQYNNGSNCDSAVDANSGIVVSEPSNFNEMRKNGSGMSFGTTQLLRKPPNKRSYYDEDTSSGEDDEGDNSHSNSNLNNNNNSNKNNCKDNGSSAGDSAATMASNTSDSLSSAVAMKKTRRSSVLSLDLDEEDSRIELKADERPLNLVTSTSGGTSSSQSGALTSPQNGIIWN